MSFIVYSPTHANLEATWQCKSTFNIYFHPLRHEVIDTDHMMSLMHPLERDVSVTSLQSPARAVKLRLFTSEEDDELPPTGPGDSDYDASLSEDDEEECDSPCGYPRIFLSGFNSRSSSTGSLPPAHNYYLK